MLCHHVQSDQIEAFVSEGKRRETALQAVVQTPMFSEGHRVKVASHSQANCSNSLLFFFRRESVFAENPVPTACIEPAYFRLQEPVDRANVNPLGVLSLRIKPAAEPAV